MDNKWKQLDEKLKKQREMSKFLPKRGKSVRTKIPSAIPIGNDLPVFLVKTVKPPRLRFKPGNFLRVEGSLYEVIYIYRVLERPHEWIYALAKRESLSPYRPNYPIGMLLEAAGAGSQTPRIVYDAFRNSMDAMRYFSDILAGNYVMHQTFHQLQEAKYQFVSEGAIMSTVEVDEVGDASPRIVDSSLEQKLIEPPK